MEYSKEKLTVLDHFNTVETFSKEVMNITNMTKKFNLINPNSPSRCFEKILIDKMLRKVSKTKDAVIVNLYNIQQKDAVMECVKMGRIDNMKLNLEITQKQRFRSPPPWLRYIGFRRQAFFNRRQRILKPGLKIKKLNIFTDFKNNIPTSIIKQDIKSRLLSPQNWAFSRANDAIFWESESNLKNQSQIHFEKSVDENNKLLYNKNLGMKCSI